MCAYFPTSRAPCRTVFTILDLLENIRWFFYGEAALLRELKRLKIELRRQQQALTYLCTSVRADDEALGRILSLQLSLYLEKGLSDPLRNQI